MRSVTNYLRLSVFGMVLPLFAFAEEAVGAAAHDAGSMLGPAAGFGIGLAVLGAALGQGKIAAAYMDGAARNPNASGVMRTPLILSLVFVETLVLFTLLICFSLIGKIH